MSNSLQFELLEPRLLLSADLIPFSIDMVDPDFGNDLSLRLDEAARTLQLLDNRNGGSLLAEKAIDEVNKVSVTGTDGDDRLALDISGPLDLEFGISFDGGLGDDRLALDFGSTVSSALSFLGGAGQDTISATQDADFDLDDDALALGGDLVSLTDVEKAELTGGAGANLLDAGGFSGEASLFGLGGDDRLSGGSGTTTLDGGAGEDTLVGPAEDSVWTLTGAGAGTLGGTSFSGIENLQGAADNEDTFVVTPGGSLAGVIDGGAGGFDSLVIEGGTYDRIDYLAASPDSGSVDLDGNRITYVGLEPVITSATATDVVITATDNPDVVLVEEISATQITVSSPSIESHTFLKPTDTLTIRLGTADDAFGVGNRGEDRITLQVGAFGGLAADLMIEGLDDVIIGGATLVDMAGKFVVESGRNLTVEDGAGVTTLADIELTALANRDLSLNDISLGDLFSEVLEASASIVIGSAALAADNVRIQTSSNATKLASFEIFEDGLLGLVTGDLAEMTLVGGVEDLTFVPADTGAGTPPKIIREFGNWLDDGFEAGQEIKVIGSGSNDDDYTIESVTIKEITLVATDVLSSESTGDTASIAVKETFTSVAPDDVPLISLDRDGNRVGSAITSGEISNALERQLALAILNLFDAPFEFVDATSTSDIELRTGARITAGGDVDINAAASSNVTLNTPGLILGGASGESTAKAFTTLRTGAQIDADGVVNIASLVNNTLDVTMSMSAGQVFGVIKIPGPQLGFAHGVGISETATLVESGASVQGLDINVAAKNFNDFSVNARTSAKALGGFGASVGVALSDMTSSALARFDGSATADRDITVLSESENLNNDVEANAAPKKTIASRAVDAVKGKLQSTSLNPKSGASGLDISAGVAIAESSNLASAELGGTASLTALGDISVSAEAEDNFKAIAIGGAKAGAALSIGGAVAVSDYGNTANAAIGSGADVIALGNLVVSADALIPNQIEIDEDLQAIRDLEFSPGPLDGSGPVAFLDSLDTFFTELDLLVGTFARFTPYISKTLGVEDKIATTFVAATSEAGNNGFALSGAVNVLSATNSATATIGEDAVIAAANVDVTATATIETINIGGIPSVKNLIVPANKSEGSGVGGTYAGIAYNNSATAFIDDGATVAATAGDVAVRALARNFVVDVVEAGAKAADFALSGGFAINEFTNESLAYIEDQANVTAVRDVIVDADTDVEAIVVTATISSGGGVGFGVSLAINEIMNTTLAFIGDRDAADLVFPGPGEVAAGRDVEVTADTKERLYAISASASAGGASGSAPAGGDVSESAGKAAASNAKSKAGIGISGDVSINDIGDTTQAFISDDVTVNATRDLTIAAKNDAFLLSVAGAVSLKLGATAGGGAFAGAFTLNDLSRDVRAYASDANLTARNLSISAVTDDQIVAVTAGLGGALKPTGTTAVIGSVGINDIESDTLAGLWGDVSATMTGDLVILAKDSLTLTSVSGSIGFAGSALGAAVDVGLYDRTVRALIGPDPADGTGVADVDLGGNLSLKGLAEEAIVSVGAAGAAGTQSFGAAGSASSQNLDTDVEASIGAGALVSADKNLLIDARNLTDLVAVGGAVAFGSSAGIGLALGNVNVNRTVKASIGDGATVDAYAVTDPLLAGADIPTLDGQPVNGLRVNAFADENLRTWGAAAGAAASSASVTASAAVDTNNSLVEATIGNADINLGTDLTAEQDQSVQVTARHDSELLGVGGGISVSGGSAGLGASNNTEVLNKTVRAHIDSGASVAALEDVIVSAQSREAILSIAVTLGGSSSIGIAGAASVLTLNTTTEAYIGAGALVTAGGDMIVTADELLELTVVDVSAALSGNVGVGGSVAVVVQDNDVSAYIGDGATVAADGSVAVTASSDLIATSDDPQADTLAGKGIGVGSASGGGSTAVGIANTTFVRNDSVEAYIGAGASVTALGLRLGVDVLTGEKDAGGGKLTEVVAGLSVAALSFADVITVAIGGSGAGSAGVAGSATVNVWTDRTRAYIADNARINENNGGAADGQRVNVLASDRVDLLAIAGGLSGGGSLGIGAGADVGVLNRTTEAFIGASALVNANEDIRLQAFSEEDIISVSASAGLGGSVGIGAAAGVYTLNADTRAFIGAGATASAVGNVLVAADSDTAMDIIAGNIAASGAFSLGATAAVSVVDKTTEAYIGDGASVDALGKRDALEAKTGAFTTGFAADSGSDTEVSAPNIDNSDANDESLTQQRTAAAATSAVKGVIVTASNKDDIESIAVSAGGSGGVDVQLAGSVNVHSVDTSARIGDNARINQNSLDPDAAQSVLVAAGSDYYHLGVGGVGSLSGTGSVTPGADVTVLTLNTEAEIGSGALVDAAGDVLVSAFAQEDILSITAALSGSGVVGVAGAVSVIDIDNTTSAHIDGGAVVTAGGNVGVAAQDLTEVDVIAGSVGIGVSGGGVGASVGVTTIEKDTEAYVAGGATVEAKGNALAPIAGFDGASVFGLSVQAESSEDIFAVAASGAGGTFVGIAGAVTVEVVDSDTLAYIGGGAMINQDPTDAAPAQSVNVGARNDLKVFVIDGSIGGAAFGGASGAVDVGILRNDTSAFIGNGAQVAAAGDVDIQALSGVDVDTFALSAAGGAVGIGGGVTVYALGGNLSGSYRVDGNGDGELDNSADGLAGADGQNTTTYADGQVAAAFGDTNNGFAPLLGGFEQGPDFDPATVDGNAETIALAADPGFETGDAVVYRNGGGENIGGLTDGETYYVIVDETDATEVQLAASRSDALGGTAIDLDPSPATGTSHRLDSLTAGGTQAAAGSIEDSESGGAVDGAANQSDPTALSSGTSAFIGQNATVAAGGDIDLDARQTVDVDMTAGGGGLGGVGFGAGVGIINIGSDIQAYIGSGADVSAGGSISLDASLDEDVGARGVAATFSGLASIGAAVIVVNDNSDVAAFIEDGASLAEGASLSGSTLSIGAESDIDLLVSTFQAAVSGTIALGASVSVAEAGGKTKAYIGDFADLDSFGAVDVVADSDATVAGLDLGTMAVAVSGGVVGGAAGVALGTISADTDAYIGRADLQISGDILVEATSQASVDVDADGGAIGIAAVGAMVGIGRINGATRAQVDADALIRGRDLEIEADATNRVTANTIGAGAGLFAGTFNQAKAVVDGDVAAFIGDADVRMARDVGLQATSDDQATAGTIGVEVAAVRLGVSLARAEVTSDVSAYVGDGAFVSGRDLDIAATGLGFARASALSSGGGLLSGSGADVDAVMTPSINAYIGAGAEVVLTGDLNLSSVFEGSARAVATGLSVGAGQIGVSLATSTLSPSLSAYVGAGADVRAEGGVTLESRSNVAADGSALANESFADASSSGGGVLSGNGADADAIALASLDTYVAAGAMVEAGDDVTLQALSSDDARSVADGTSIGVIGIGVILSDARAGGMVKAHVDSNARITTRNAGADLRIAADAVVMADALAEAAGGGVASGNGADSGSRTQPNVQVFIGSDAVVDVLGDIVLGANAEVHSIADSEGDAVGALGVGLSFADARNSSTVSTSLGDRASLTSGGNIMVMSSFNTDETGNQIDFAAKSDANASVSSGIGGAGADARVNSTATVSTLLGSDAALGADGNIILSSVAYNSVDARADGSAEGILAGGATLVDVVVNTSATTTVGAGAQLAAGQNLMVGSVSNSAVKAFASGGTGSSLSDSLKNLFSGNLSGVGIPSIVSAGGSVTEVVVNNTAKTDVLSDADLIAGDMAVLMASAMVSVDADAVMRSDGTLGSSATAVTDVDIDSDALVNLGADATIAANTVVLDADNQIGANVFAQAFANADGAPFAVGITRLDIGTAADRSLAKITLGAGSDISATEGVLIDATNQQKDGNLLSNARSKIDSTIFIGTATTRADGTAYVDSLVESAPGSVINSSDIEVHAESDYVLQRKPESIADTVITKFVEVVKRVTETIERTVCEWAPWPLNELCKVVTRTIVKLVTVIEEVTEAATELTFRGGLGVVTNDVINLNGEIFSFGTQDRFLRINADGSIDPDSNVGVTFDGNTAIVDDISGGSSDNDPSIRILVPFGNIVGNAVIYINKLIDEVRIENFSDNSLQIQQINMNSFDEADPDVIFESATPGQEYDFAPEIFDSNLIILNDAESDLIFTQSISNVSAFIDVSNTGGDILFASGDVVLEAGDVGHLFMSAANGNIGTDAQPLQVRLVRGQVMPDGTLGDMPAELVARAGGDIHLAVTGVNTTNAAFQGNEVVEGIAVNAVAGGLVDLAIGESLILDVDFIEHSVDGIYNIIRAESGSQSVSITLDTGSLAIGVIPNFEAWHPENLAEILAGTTGTIAAQAGLVSLSASGSIFDADDDVAAEISALQAVLTAGSGIGEAGDPLETAVGNLEADGGAGGIWIDNFGGLTIGGVSGLVGLAAQGPIIVTAQSPLTVAEDVVAAGDVVLTAAESEDPGDDLEVLGGASVVSTGGNVSLRAGDDLRLAAGSLVIANGTVSIDGDFGDADPGVGSTIELSGSILGTSVAVNGGADGDTVSLTSVLAPTTVSTRGGDDRIFVGSNATPTSNSGGNLLGIQHQLLVDGGADDDLLDIDSSGDISGQVAILTGDRLTGLGMTGAIQYESIESLELSLGSGDDIVNVRGTSATTDLNLGGGDDKVYVSSEANVDQANQAGFDFLTGHLDDLQGDLDIEAGTGRNLLMVSDEAATEADTSVLITDQPVAGLPADAEIAVTGLAQGAISYRADADGNFAGGITIWTGSGDEVIAVDGTHQRDGVRTTTTLNTGGGADGVDVALTDGEDGFFVLNTQAGEDDIDASASSLPLILFGGADDDEIIAGSGSDIVFGDRGRVHYLDEAGTLAAVLGGGGPGDFTDGALRDPSFLFTVDPDIGGDDTISAGDSADIVFGGNGGDTIDGGSDDAEDVVLGDNGRITRGGNGTAEPGGETSVLSFNFNATSSSRTVTGEAGAEGARAGNWNNLESDGPTTYGNEADEIIVFDDGKVAPGITITWGEDLDGRADDLSTDSHSQISPGDDQDLRLFEGYLETSINHTIGVDLTGLSGHFQSYDIYVYLDADNSHSKSGTSARAITDGTTTFYLDDADGNTFTGEYIEVDSTDPFAPQAGNYVVFRGLTADLASIRIDDDGTLLASSLNRPAITALQVVGQHHPIDTVETTEPDFGGDDRIATGGGADLAIGGSGADEINTAGPSVAGRTDADVAVGDNARATFMIGELREIRTTAPDQGGGDLILTGNGEDIILGGIGDDEIRSGTEQPFDNGIVTILSVNFQSDVDKGMVTGVAGAAQAGNWNNLVGDGPRIFGNDPGEVLVLDDGTAVSGGPLPGITVTWGENLDSRPDDLSEDSHNEIDPNTQNERLFEGYLHSSTSRTIGVDVAGLDTQFVGRYDVYVYIDAENNDSRSGESLRQLSIGDTTLFLDDPDGNTFAGEFVESGAGGLGNYVVFRDVEGDSFSLRIDDEGSSWANRPALSGLQIVGGPDKNGIVVGGDFDSDAAVGDNGLARFFGGELYELKSGDPELGGGDRIITGEDGDLVIGGNDADWIDGQAGNDLLMGDDARLIFFEGGIVGFDSFDIDDSDDDPFGILGIQVSDSPTDGDDTIIGGADDDLSYGQGGNDTFLFGGLGLGSDGVVEAGNADPLANDPHDRLDFSTFGAAIDVELWEDDRQTVNGGSFQGDVNLRLTLYSGTAVEGVVGTIFSDDLDGNVRNNTLIGGDGNDWIDGESGDDLLLGGLGADFILGRNGSDLIDGGGGDDVIFGSGFGDDDDDDDDDNNESPGSLNILLGGAGDDWIRGGSGADLIDGEAGDDQLRGRRGNDVISGGLDNDFIRGDSGRDTIEGGDGIDNVNGGSGIDRVTAGTFDGLLGLLGPVTDFEDSFDYEGFQFVDPTVGENDRPLRAWVADFLGGVPDSDFLLAAAPAERGLAAAGLDPADMAAVVAEAKDRMAAAHGLEASAFDGLTVSLADLPGLALGKIDGGSLLLDSDAAGHGWFVDPTPGDDAEFAGSGAVLAAEAGRGAEGRMDLLTAVMHELGHMVGLDHVDSGSGLMAGTLEAGERLLPSSASATAASVQLFDDKADEFLSYQEFLLMKRLDIEPNAPGNGDGDPTDDWVFLGRGEGETDTGAGVAEGEATEDTAAGAPAVEGALSAGAMGEGIKPLLVDWNASFGGITGGK